MNVSNKNKQFRKRYFLQPLLEKFNGKKIENRGIEVKPRMIKPLQHSSSVSPFYVNQEQRDEYHDKLVELDGQVKALQNDLKMLNENSSALKTSKAKHINNESFTKRDNNKVTKM